MFSKDSQGGGTPSIIGSDLTITGNLVSDGDIQMDGILVGDIDSRSVTIGQSARVEGHISARELRISGAVIGEVKADNVELTRSAKVTGDIVHQSLAIEPGANVEGHIRRQDGRDKVKLASVETAEDHKTAAVGGDGKATDGAAS